MDSPGTSSGFLVEYIMPSFKILKPYLIGILTSITLFLLGLAILGISLLSANREQAATIQQIITRFN